tara:strand:- start:4673 stop:7141 length:2469 start_codon:yes stop_codon:yes gene_type:complete
MAIEKQAEPFIMEEPVDEVLPKDIDIAFEDMEGNVDETTETEMEDGSVVIDFAPGDLESAPVGHYDNLVDAVDEDDLTLLASDLVASFEADRESRRDWAEAYVNGLDLLGMKIEDRTKPWAGAAGVYHPMMTDAVIRFQAQAMSELLPAAGPARSKIVGKLTNDRADQAERVIGELNYLTTEVMPDYRDEMEQMLFKLPLAGSAFKKVYFDPLTELPCAEFVQAEDFVVSYGASNLRKCPRYTHVIRRTPDEIIDLQAAGFYAGVELPEPERDISDIEAKYNEMAGVTETYDSGDNRHTLLEMHVTIQLPESYEYGDGLTHPYVITIDKSSLTILSIRRNWAEDDTKQAKRMHFVHYPYLPGMGFYGTSLIQTMGGLTKTATSVMRQLIDAGTLANLPAGLKARGLRIKGDNTPLAPGEFRDVDVSGGTIRDSILPLPYKEPSQTLFALLGNVVDEGRRIGAVGDLPVGDVNANAPVGTTLALMERALKVMSGIQARLHAAMKDELRIIARIVKEDMTGDYSYDVGEGFSRAEDFDGRVDIIPVSDPNAATMAQRIMQYQAALQLAEKAPQLYNMGMLHKQMLNVLGIQDASSIITLPEDIKPMDPVTENMAILKQEPTKAFAYQDHEAHIMTHMAAMEDPKIQQLVGQSPFAQAIHTAMQAHITEHLALQYRKEIEIQLGTPLPGVEEILPEDVERELSRVVAQAAGKLLRKDQAEAAAAENAKQQNDPLTQIQLRELDLKERELEHKIMKDMKSLEVEALIAKTKSSVDMVRIGSDAEREAARIGVKVAELETKDQEAAVRLALDVAAAIRDEGKADNNE